ncbi:MAG: glycosyltransferase family 2 protein [Sulfuritalea sp.]|nr:glycosyltransferase family 2 protein [Sulfuritalea sp.]
MATYNRPECLGVAIRSVLRQTVRDWRLIVVGDACDDRTAAVIAAFADDRIAYVNLPSRCGEQAIPNSIGMALADTEYIALLNHDDVLLADHLQLALARLREAQSGLFVGTAAFARFSAAMTNGGRMPIFSEVTPVERELGDVFRFGSEAFEPCSAWVFSRDLFETVGPWRASALLYRTPMEDWLLRAWRAGVGLIQASEITVLRMLTHYQQAGGAHAYEWGHGEHAMVERMFGGSDPAEIRRAIRQGLESGLVAALPRPGFSQMLLKMMRRMTAQQEWLAERLLTQPMAEVYRRTGWDAFEQFCLLAGLGRGHAMTMALRLRTGEDLPPVPDFNELLAFARANLAAGR